MINRNSKSIDVCVLRHVLYREMLHSILYYPFGNVLLTVSRCTKSCVPFAAVEDFKRSIPPTVPMCICCSSADLMVVSS